MLIYEKKSCKFCINSSIYGMPRNEGSSMDHRFLQIITTASTLYVVVLTTGRRASVPQFDQFAAMKHPCDILLAT